MKAATIRDKEVLVEEHPDPEPGAGEVLVRVRAAGVNGGDMMQRRGLYPAPAGSPQDIPGLELAGEVAGLGPGATRFGEGDRVMAIVGGGGQAELAVVHERQLMPVPAGLDWAQAGGLPEAYTTAHDALFTQMGLRPGERLLVNGGAGGVGTAAIQLARAAGASVTATVRDDALHAPVEELGAQAIPPQGFAERGPFDAILELVGAPNLADNLMALGMGGRICVIGVSAGAKTEINLLAIMGKRARLHGSTLRARPLEEKAMAARALEREVLPLFKPDTDRAGSGSARFGSGTDRPGNGPDRPGKRPAAPSLTVPIADTFPLDQAPAAYDRFEEGRKLGKIVLLA